MALKKQNRIKGTDFLQQTKTKLDIPTKNVDKSSFVTFNECLLCQL